MQTNLAAFVQDRPEHDELDSILRSCVHCGFCTATCPTYQLLGDELDGPRGRIYLLKEMLEGNAVSQLTQQHLDRCLTCRSCETTCPSGVRYGRLVDIGREIVAKQVQRGLQENITRGLMARILPYRRRFSRLMQFARLIKPLLPEHLQQKLPKQYKTAPWPQPRHARKILIFPGCVQPTLAPQIDALSAQVLDKLGISLLQVKSAGCCGALNYHLSDHQKALQFARQNIDACWPYVEQGAESIVMTASGCGVMVKEYAEILQYDRIYAEKAVKISALTKDLSEILDAEDLTLFTGQKLQTVAFQSPCTLQHGQKLAGLVEKILQQVGYPLADVDNAHMCCGSAGVYSLLQPELAEQLLAKKLDSLQNHDADLIATANIGCMTHLQSASKLKVVHWIELLSD